MRPSKIEIVFGAVITAGLLFGLWQQQQIITLLGRSGGGAAVPQAAAAPAAAPKAPPAIATVSLDLSVTGFPSRGLSQAQVVVLEFSDFQCPFCGRYIRDTYPRLSANYVDTGKVKYVFRHFPLENIHPNAKNAALAANCAGNQGRFWEMHDRLFANQQALDLPALLAYGGALGLNDGKYRSCLNGQETAPAIEADKADALRAEFTGTPAFLIGRISADGRLHAVRRVVGAQPYSVFQSAIDDVLAGKQ